MSTLDTYSALLSRRLGTTSENYHDEDARTQAINLAIQELTDEYSPNELRDKEFIDFRRYGVGLDEFEYATDAAIQAIWAESGDGVAPTSSTDKKVGTYSGSFSWTFSGGTATWVATLGSSVDLSSYIGVDSGEPSRGSVGLWLKFADYTVVSSVVLRVGSDSSNYTELTLNNPVDNKYNYVSEGLGNGTETGTPDWTAVDYLALVVTQTATSSVILDDMRLLPPGSRYVVGDLPSDVSSEHRVRLLEYIPTGRKYYHMPPAEFFRRGSTNDFTYDYSVIDGARKIFLRDTNIESVLSHHTKDPTTLSESTDESGLNSKADEVVALLALRRLLIDEGNWQAVELLNSRELRDAMSTWQGVYGKKGNRLVSAYEKKYYHSR